MGKWACIHDRTRNDAVADRDQQKVLRGRSEKMHGCGWVSEVAGSLATAATGIGTGVIIGGAVNTFCAVLQMLQMKPSLVRRTLRRF
jgi:hypothetical protein